MHSFKRSSRSCLFLGALLTLSFSSLPACELGECLPQGKVPQRQEQPHKKQWENGLPQDPSFFPIGVWLQSPKYAQAYREAGMNVFVGLWKGPTEAQLIALQAAEMPVICTQNKLGLNSEHKDIIVGWMHGDEPDNAQSLGKGKGYGPPIKPAVIVEDYKRIVAADGTRPVMLNLGQGVAWDDWRGRGVRTRHPEDYPEYAKGADIVSFDIYPAVHRHEDVAGKLEFVPRGVSRLLDWTGRRKPIWTCIEASRISNAKVKPTVRQVRAEVWMSIIHGSRGLIYFVHQFKPSFDERALLHDKELLAGVTRINEEVTRLAVQINGKAVDNLVKVTSANKEVDVAITVRQTKKSLFIFAVSMRPGNTEARFRLQVAPEGEVVERIGMSGDERTGATLPLRGRRFSDEFSGYQVRLYKVALR